MKSESCIYVVDDDAAVLQSVKAVLSELNCEVFCYQSADQFLTEATTERPGCLITDLQMPGMSGLELHQRLVHAKSPLSVVVVTGVADVPTTVTVMRSGAVTLLEKPYEPTELLRATKEALAMSQQRWQKQLSDRTVLHRMSQLTDDERQIMDAMLASKTNKAISQQLDISMRTVDRRRSAILEIMDVKSVAGLAASLSRVLPEPTTSDLNHE
ncbi:MAG: response regulator [Planctomycetia bacterium]|nr:response regulator [Planctomycetia bacterium]